MDGQLKNYDLVITDSLKELIETTNVAVQYGYTPVGGMLHIENKFIQTIILKHMQKVKFKVEKVEDSAKEGSEISVGNTYEGELSADNKVYYKDNTNTEWVFYPGDTCTLIDQKEVKPKAPVVSQGFFSQLFDLLNDKQIVKITTTKVGETLSLLINKDNKLITMTGTPEEIDSAILSHLHHSTAPNEQEFSVEVTDAPESDDEVAPSAKKKVLKIFSNYIENSTN